MPSFSLLPPPTHTDENESRMKEEAADDEDDDGTDSQDGDDDDDDDEGTITEFRFVPSDKAACEPGRRPSVGRLHDGMMCDNSSRRC